jgi:hypothetical protein
MDEDLLSPIMGRMIDRAKAELHRADAGAGPLEGIALLLADEEIVAALGTAHGAAAGTSAAERALARVPAGEGRAVEAAAVAIFGEQHDTAGPGSESRRALTAVNPDLPLVVKQRGRWVVRLLSDLPEDAG